MRLNLFATWWEYYTNPRFPIFQQSWQAVITFAIVNYAAISILAGIIFAVRDIPMTTTLIQHAFQQLIDQYPTDLEVRWQGGQLSANRSEPIAVPYPSAWDHDETLPKTLGYIAPQLHQPSAFAQLPQSSLLVATDTQLAVNQPQGGWSLFELRDLPFFDHDFTLSHTTLPAFIRTWQDMVATTFQSLQWLYPIGYFLLVPWWRLLAVAMNLAVVYFLLRWVERPASFRQLLKLGLRLMVIAELAAVLSHLLIPNSDVNIFSIMFWLGLIITGINLWPTLPEGAAR